MTTKFFPIFLLTLLLSLHPADAVVFGQLDDFQDGTTNNWTNGGLATPVMNVSTGGPGGVGDSYALVTATGGGPGGRLTTFNFQQWAGNFIAAGITTLQIDLLNQSAVPLSIRFAFEVDTFNGAPGYLTAPMLLAVGSGWQHFSISIAAPDLIAVDNPDAYSSFFTNIGEVRIINEAGTSNLNGDPVVGMLGFDNVHAVPEPTTTALAIGGVLLLGANLLRKQRRAGRQ